MDSNNIRGSKELLIKFWMTSNGMWLFYCHLFGFVENMGLITTSVEHMGMRNIKEKKDLENVLGEILNSHKTSSPRFPPKLPLKFNIADSTEDILPEKIPDFEIEHRSRPLQKDTIPPTKRDQSFCIYSSQLERFFETLPVGYSTTPSCVGCSIQVNESCLKEYRFNSLHGDKVDFSCPALGKIDLKGICCEI